MGKYSLKGWVQGGEYSLKGWVRVGKYSLKGWVQGGEASHPTGLTLNHCRGSGFSLTEPSLSTGGAQFSLYFAIWRYCQRNFFYIILRCALVSFIKP